MREYKDEITLFLLGTSNICVSLYGYFATPSDKTILLICASVGVYLLIIVAEKLISRARYRQYLRQKKHSKKWSHSVVTYTVDISGAKEQRQNASLRNKK